MWIDAFHDDLGRRAFEKLTKPRWDNMCMILPFYPHLGLRI
jgi:hypothetical protein